MYTNSKYIIILFSIAMLILSCKDKPIDTPSPTEVEDVYPNFVDTGANMVAYKVDGKIRVAKNISKADSGRGYLSCGYSLHEKTKRFYFIGERISDNSFESATIILYDLLTEGTYNLKSTNEVYNIGTFYSGPNESSAKGYKTNQIDSGVVIITKIDTIKGYVTGRFEFTGRYVFGSDTKKITEGRFDVKYYR